MVHEKKSGHIGGSFSIADLIAYLFSNFDLTKKEGDKLILSKGHAVPILYAVFSELGVIDENELSSFRDIDSRLQGHPDKVRLPATIATTGALGQGLSISIGHALALKIKKKPQNVFCIIGDGEMQEGQVWESLMLAPKYVLENLCCIVDYNKSQNDGLVEDILSLGDLQRKVESFGWNVVRCNGHDTDEIQSAINSFISCTSRPTFIILDTIKGMGVSFMQTSEWHAKVPNNEEFERALGELNESY